METLDRLAIHTMTTKPWDLPTACAEYGAAGVRGAGVWRQWLEGRSLNESRRMLDDHGVSAVSLVRGGFFVSSQTDRRQAAIDDNRRAIDEAAEIGAPQVVLVCGAAVDVPLSDARRQIHDGLAACIPHAASTGVKLSIEPLHPMYADCRSAINTVGQCNDMIDRLGGEHVGIAVDVYHVWWDPQIATEIRRAGKTILGFHVCDWMTPTVDLLNDRGLMGDGCIDIPGLRAMVEAAGFTGWLEVEIFSDRHWASDQHAFLTAILEGYRNHV